MKLSALALFVAGAGLATVNASPLRVTLVSSTVYPVVPNSSNDVAIMRPNMTLMEPIRVHRPCGGIRNKALTLSNSIRKIFGLPPIEAHPFIGTPSPVSQESDSDFRTQVINPDDKQVSDDDRHHHAHHKHKHHHKHGRFHHFKLRRLWKSFIHLGGWEGAAVAFVVGCGLGVVLRLMWVMTVVTYRSCVRGETVYNVYEQAPVYLDEEDVIVVAPPQYIEKTSMEEAVKDNDKVTPSS